MGTETTRLGRLLCLIGRHDYRYIGFRWVQDTPYMKSGHDHQCVRCCREAYFGSRRATEVPR